MRSWSRPRLTYANVMATVAVFLALGGTGYAVSQLPASSVGTKQLKNGAVKTKKLATHAVTGATVANHSLGGQQIKAATLGNVPSASHAHRSDLLGGIGASGFLPSGTLQRYGPVAFSFNSPNTPFVSVPPFTIYGYCFINFGGHDSAITYLADRGGHWAYASRQSDGTVYSNADYPPNIADPYLGQTQVAPGTKGVISESGSAVAPSGRQISFQLYQGTNIVGNPGKCVFGGTVVVEH